MSEKFLTPDDNYYYELTRYLRKNSKKTEYDFLKESISILKSNITLNEKYSDKDLLIKLKTDKPRFVNDSDKDLWLKQKLNYKKGHLKTEIEREKILLFDYKIRINKLPLEKIDINNTIDKPQNKQKLKKPFDDIFKDINSFLIFDKFMKNQIVNPYKDISFLFQQLNLEKRLLNIKHLEFAKIIFDKEYINKKTYEVISNKKGFESKSTSSYRLNNYYNIAKEIDRIKP